MSLPPSNPRPRRRWPWIFAGGFFLGGAVLAGLLLVPGIQGWLLRRWVASQPGWTVGFEHVGVGPTGVDTRGLEFAMPGVEASTEPFVIRVAPTRLFSKRELRVEQVEARKIRLVITPEKFAPRSAHDAPPAPFDGVLRLLRVPLPWALDAAHLDGEIVVRDAGEPRLTGNFSVRGGGLTAETPGEFNYELAADSMILPPGPDHKFTSTGTIRLAQTSGNGIARVAIDGDLHLPLYGRLKLPAGRLTLEVTAIEKGEKYTGQLALGSAAKIELDATLDAATSILTGRVTFHADQSAAASLLGGQVPQAAVAGNLTFTLNLRNGDLDAAIAGDLKAGDWQKLTPQLSGFDAFAGRLTAALSRRGDQLAVQSLEATLRGGKSPAEARLTLSKPFDPRKIPATPLAEITLAHWPVDWLNPFLANSGVNLAPGEFAAGWSLAVEREGTVRLEPIRAVTLGPLLAQGAGAPALPALNFSFHPRILASAARVAVTIDDLTATSQQGDRLEANLAATREASTGELQTKGEFKATLPSILASGNAPPPFAFNGTWDAAIAGNRLHLAALGFTARGAPDVPPYLSLELLRPFDLDWQTRTVLAPVETQPPALARGTGASDWLRLRVTNLPLGWLSRWSGQTVSGTFATGESTLGPAPEKGFVVQTTGPWRLSGLSVGNGPRPPGSGSIELSASPGALLRGDQLAVRVDGLKVVDDQSDSLAGEVQATVDLADQKISGDLTLAAQLPALPHSAGTFGALHAETHAKFHSMTPRIMGVDEFDLKVRNVAGELLAVHAPQPFVAGLSNEAMVAMSTLEPFTIRTGRFPLSWLRPWSGALELDGELAPAELTLAAKTNRYALHAGQPLRLENFSARRAGREVVREATVVFAPGLDWLFLCQVKPVFQFACDATAHVNHATLDLADSRVLDLNLDLKFKANDKIALADGIDFTARLDLSRFKHGADFGLPTQGILTLLANGGLLGADPTEFKVRLEGLAGAKSGEVLPATEVALKGKISLDQVLDGHVEFKFASMPQPTDAAFDVKINLVGTGLNITSALRSKFVDGNALLALAREFPTAKPAAAVVPVSSSTEATKAKAPSSSTTTLPFWGEVQGSFDLEIGALAYDAYRIDRVRGRLDVDERSFRVHDLSGEMFAGRWSGGFGFEHDPATKTGEHTLAGAFDIAQFDSARVVQAVFPKQLSTVDAQITVHSSLSSHGNSFVSLIDRSVADFTVTGEKGVVRLAVPKSDLVSTAAVFGGTVLLSPELRALGRLLKKFSEMPMDQLRITGRRAPGGEVDVDEFIFQSPQAQLTGRGRVLADPAQPLMSHPLELSLQLAVKDELAVILGGMSLLEKKPRADGFRVMREPFRLAGLAGAPDTTPLYDLLAKGVSGSSGTWGFLMRRVQAEVAKKKVAAPAMNPTP